LGLKLSLNKIFLPGSDKQIEIFINKVDVKDKSVLVIGAGSEEIAKRIKSEHPSALFLIIDEQESLLISRLSLKDEKEIQVRLMDFDNTDFNTEQFDIVYAQASVSAIKRNKIIKEIKRILKPGGIMCAGEIVNRTNEIPPFIRDIWANSGIAPLKEMEFSKYYTEKGFEIQHEEDLSYTLKDFYSAGSNLLRQSIKDFSEKEKSYYKKLLNQISHESNAYLKLGGEKHIGFRMIIAKKV
jgi:ubiquinone/menaquinone biosynthesis C-methylase UbiE